jgi:hypothetical protein
LMSLAMAQQLIRALGGTVSKAIRPTDMGPGIVIRPN